MSRVFQNSSVSASIFGVPESLLLSLWELLKAVSSSEFQDINKYRETARLISRFFWGKSVNNYRRAFDLWTEVFTKTMTANLHLLIAHGDLYQR